MSPLEHGLGGVVVDGGSPDPAQQVQPSHHVEAVPPAPAAQHNIAMMCLYLHTCPARSPPWRARAAPPGPGSRRREPCSWGCGSCSHRPRSSAQRPHDRQCVGISGCYHLLADDVLGHEGDALPGGDDGGVTIQLSQLHHGRGRASAHNVRGNRLK